MESKLRLQFALAVLVVLVALFPGSTPASTLNEPARRHHLTVTAGYARHLGATSDGTSVFASGGFSYVSPDLKSALDAGVRYRVFLWPGFDLAIEGHRTEASRTTTVTAQPFGDPTFKPRLGRRTDWWGVGLRRTFTAGGIRPFLQMGIVHARDLERRGDSGWSPIASDLAVAMATGGELVMSPSLSVPIELGWMYATPADDALTLGLRTGITWHLGR